MDQQIDSSPTGNLQPQSDNYETDWADYRKTKVRLDRRIGEWLCYKNKAAQNRSDRYADLDVIKMREDGKIARNETFVPKRVIDNNIRRSLSDAMLFLNSQKRLAYFRCIDDPLVDTRQLESDVTKGLTYKKWYKEFMKHYDGAELHGWDSMEIIYDESKPLRVAFEHIGYDRLLFNRDLEDIQDDEFLMLEKRASCEALGRMVRDQGFNKDQVDRILAYQLGTNKRDNQTFIIYKVYYKFAGVVYIAFYAQKNDVTDWLRAPEPLKCGILSKIEMPKSQISIGADIGAANENDTSNVSDPNMPPKENMLDVGDPTSINPTTTTPMGSFQEEPIRMYPVFLLMSDDDEQMAIATHKGQAFFAMPNQEAATALITAYLNGMLKANMICASVDSDDIEASNRLEDITLGDDSILPVPIRWHNRPYPDSTCLNALQYLDMENSQSSGKLATAVSNRKDARKTAEELQYAQESEAKITTTDLAGYSEFLRDLFDFAWLIIKSQAIAGNIELCRKQIAQTDAMGQQSMVWTNDLEVIDKNYDVRPAGDVDVIQVQIKLQQMMQDWPVIQTIPGLLQPFIEDFIRLRYPERADMYIAAMKAGDPKANIIKALLAIVQGSLQPAEVNALSPQEQAGLQQTLQQAQAIVNPQPPTK